MASKWVTNDTITFIKTVVDFLEKTADDYKQVIPEAVGFERECRHVYDILNPILTEDPDFNSYLHKYITGGMSDRTRHQGQQAILKEIVRTLYLAEKKINQYLTQNAQQNKTILQKIQWFVKRTYTAQEYRAYFKGENEGIRKLMNDLITTRNLAAGAGIVTVNRFEQDMPKEGFNFWIKYIGKDIVTPWERFSEAYTLLYGDMEPNELQYVRKLLCSSGGSSITVFGYIGLIRKHSFPFENVGTDLPPVEKTLSEESRMEIAKMVMQLVSEFASEEMKGYLTAMYTWYDGIPRNDEKALQERANEWARLKNELRRVEVPTAEHEKADKLDGARRAISFFYQRYMVMWRIGKLSREAFSGVDFPGKARIRDFIRYVQPLDKANYLISMKKDESTWKQKKPQVYQFLEQLLVDESKKDVVPKPLLPKKEKQQVSNTVIYEETKTLDEKKLPEIIQLPPGRGPSLTIKQVLESAERQQEPAAVSVH
ncbi:hypothetical protein BDB00DRAFT_932164 [Zychaea mexicana]|uniref:uncharacterized protein n=1 Tax=Zychaea mexicana TaxID=64656 RepID=UPI0022FDBEC7|nr:uncharacterized protein BDB00DRAFT_932164 [Zychaea mexicana]KAI9489147.1 hypothetical protein BDB00DRAFT_932164 [Zychaea mexicana]